MKIPKVAQAIVWISGLIGIIGFIAILARVTKEPNFFIIGAAFIIAAVFMYGFSYIVQAAYVYIQNQPDEDEKDGIDGE